MLVEFLAQRLAAYGFQIRLDDLEKLLEAGSCCLLFDGLDEVPTDQGRAAVSRLSGGLCAARSPKTALW